MSNIELFTKARQYLVDSLEPTIECYLTGIWDPHIKYVLIKETVSIIDKDLEKEFPNLEVKLRPNVKFRMHDNIEMTEVSIQNFYNQESFLTYLGSAGIESELYDFYYRESFGPMSDYIYTAKYGHGYSDHYSGSKTAQAEYYVGAVTPLAIAYGMALEDGII